MKFVGATPPNDYDLSTRNDRQVIVLCIPNSPLWTALYRGLLVAPCSLRFFRWDKSPVKPISQECFRILNEAKFMSNDCFEELNYNMSELQFTLKAILAQLSEDKQIKYYIDKPMKPVLPQTNHFIERPHDSVFQATRYLDPLAQIDQQFTIADIIATATTKAVTALDPIGQTTLALEPILDTTNEELTNANTNLTNVNDKLITHNITLDYLMKSFYAGLDINPLSDESFFSLFRRSLNATGYLNDESYLKQIYFQIQKIRATFSTNKVMKYVDDKPSDPPFSNPNANPTLDVTDTVACCDNEQQASIATSLNAINDNLTAANVNLNEAQYGIKYFYTLFRHPNTNENNGLSVIYSQWPKPVGATLEFFNRSVFWTYDVVGRGHSLIHLLFLSMFDRFQSDIENDASDLYGGGWNWKPLWLSKANTFLDKFQVAFLFSDSLSLFTHLFNQLATLLTPIATISTTLSVAFLQSGQSYFNVMNQYLSRLVRLTAIDDWLLMIASKDCCQDNGSTTVTNPDGSQTTTPNQPTYPPVDPNDPTNPVTTEPYKKPPITQANDADAVCGFIWYVLNELADFLEWLIGWLDGISWVFSTLGITGFPAWVVENAIKYESVWLAKLGQVALRTLASKWLGLAGIVADGLPDYIREVRDDLSCGSQRTTIKIDELETLTIEALQVLTLQNQLLDFASYCIHLFYSYGLYSPLENATGIDIADYAQYCPCPTAQNWTGLWNSAGGNLRLTQSGNNVSGYYETTYPQLTLQGTANGKSLTGTWVDAGFNPPHTGTITWQMNANNWDNWTGTYTSSASNGGNWNGERIS